ncbi:MAG: efflux RND transporter periplasmic adaptor subunit, partial [Methylococcaceae bacterium]|nr:efflux RND transporter periplasmic adaptor subunit [Methylococcaceae bacterium]
EASQAAARTAAAQVGEARAAIATAQSLLTETVLRAPFDGAVVKRNLEPGDMGLPGSAVLTLQSSQRLRVEAAIPEDCAGRLTKDMNLTARIGEKDYAAKVEEIAPAIDPQTRTVLVKAGLENPSAAQPGAFAWLQQACGRRRALLVPLAAVSRSGQLESVHRVVGGIARLRQVRTGKVREDRVEILSGLQEGDVVLLGGGK